MKLTKRQTKAHNEAIALANCGRKLTLEEKGFVWDNFAPGASNNIGAMGQFFTPWEGAWDCAVLHGDRSGNVVDLCAGIGVMAGTLVTHNPECKVTCFEIVPEFIELGKKLVPEATWIQADCYSLEFVQRYAKAFSSGVSNPPYGKANGCVRELRAIEILADITEQGATMVLPAKNGKYGVWDNECAKPYHDYIRAKREGWGVQRTSCDLTSAVFKDTGIKVQAYELYNDNYWQ